MQSESLMAADYAALLAGMDEGPLRSEINRAVSHPEKYGVPDVRALIVESQNRGWPTQNLCGIIPFASVKVVLDVPEKRVRNLMCGAWEGGSNYWLAHKATKGLTQAKQDAYRLQLAAEGEDDPHIYKWMYPFIEGVTLVLEESSDDDEHDGPWELNREKLIAGLQVMADKYPWHYANFMQENDDAETADVFIQCCLFGEIVYG